MGSEGYPPAGVAFPLKENGEVSSLYRPPICSPGIYPHHPPFTVLVSETPDLKSIRKVLTSRREIQHGHTTPTEPGKVGSSTDDRESRRGRRGLALAQRGG